MKIDIKHLLNKKRSAKNLRYYPINPEKDWLIILLSFFCLVFVGSLCVNIAFSGKDVSTDVSVITTPNKVEATKDKQDPLLLYKQKKESFEMRKKEGTSFVDPAF